jgi:hypothetical protein
LNDRARQIISGWLHEPAVTLSGPVDKPLELDKLSAHELGIKKTSSPSAEQPAVSMKWKFFSASVLMNTLGKLRNGSA